MRCRVRRKVGEAVNFLSGDRIDTEARTAAGEGGRSRTFSYKLSTASVDFAQSTNRSHPWTARVDCTRLYQAIITRSRCMTCALLPLR